MPTPAKPIKWVTKAAKDLRPGDCTKHGAGRYRTVSRVEMIGNGVVRIFHHETVTPPYEDLGEEYRVQVASETPTNHHATRREDSA